MNKGYKIEDEDIAQLGLAVTVLESCFLTMEMHKFSPPLQTRIKELFDEIAPERLKLLKKVGEDIITKRQNAALHSPDARRERAQRLAKLRKQMK